MKNWYKNLGNEWKATIRTFVQSLGGALLFFVVSMANTALDWANGDVVDWAGTAANTTRAATALVLGAFISLVTFVMNKFGKDSAQYG